MALRESIDFTVRFVSPAFVGGAGSRVADTQLEHQGRKPRHVRLGPDGDGLRVPSLRGVLRFWFRAKEGSRFASTTDLARAEAGIFGSTDHGQGVRIVPRGQSEWRPIPLTDSAGGAKAYLGYGPLNYQSGEVTSRHRMAFRDAIPEEADFRFRAFGRPAQLEELRRCLTLLHLFGGLGARSRRGWGSVAIDGIGMPPVAAPANQEAIVRWFQDRLGTVWPDDSPLALTKLPDYSCFSDSTAIRVTDVVVDGSYEDVFELFYRRFEATRLWRPRSAPRCKTAVDDHDLERSDALGHALTGVPLRLAFGLPYSPSSRNDGWRIEYQGRGPGNVEITRRSSPLLLKVLRVGDGKLCGVALHLAARFFGQRGVEVGAKGKPNRRPAPATTAIDDYLRAWPSVPLPPVTKGSP